jgi:maltoporin
MDKSMYKQLVAEYMRKNAKLEEQNLELEQKTQDYYFDIRNKNLEIHMLKEENTKLRIALCNLRDEYLDMGGDVNQLELFDKDNPSQLKLDFEIEKTSNGDFEVK